MAKSKVTNPTDATILGTDRFEIRITKEEIAEVITAQAEHDLHTEHDSISKQREELKDKLVEIGKKESEEIETVKEFYKEKAEKEIPSDVRTSFTSMGVEICVSTNPFQIILKLNQRNDSPITLSLSTKDKPKIESLFEEAKDKISAINAKYDKEHQQLKSQNLELAARQIEITKSLSDLPRHQRYIKSQLTRKALSNSEEGKDILTMLGTTIPILPPKTK